MAVQERMVGCSCCSYSFISCINVSFLLLGDRPDSSNSLLLENSSECSSTISSSTEEGGEQEQDRVATPDDQELRDDEDAETETRAEKGANSVRVRPAIPPQLRKKVKCDI